MRSSLWALVAGEQEWRGQRSRHSPLPERVEIAGEQMVSWRKRAAHAASSGARALGTLHLLRWYREVRHDYRVLVLTYHEISGGTREPESVVSASRFRQHVHYLKNHYRLVPLSEAIEALRTPDALKHDIASITFDDGYLGNYEYAWPVLRAERIPATIFLTSAFLDKGVLWFHTARQFFESYFSKSLSVTAPVRDQINRTVETDVFRQSTGSALVILKQATEHQRNQCITLMEPYVAGMPPTARPLTWQHVRELLRGRIEFGCHTETHPILSGLSATRQREEIVRSRDRIAAQTGTVPTLFAYPNGGSDDYDQRTIDILQDANFIAACTTAHGANRPGCNLYRLQRISVGNDSTSLLAARLAGVFDEAVRAWLPQSLRHAF